MSQTQWLALSIASFETLYMVLISSILAALAGLPLGVMLYSTGPRGLLPRPRWHQLLSFIVNIMRSIPFIILMIALIPLTRSLVGTSIGTHAAIVPLAIGAMPFFARLVANSLADVNIGLVEVGCAMGASNWQIITRILLPEALPSLIHAFIVTLITLVGYSAMAGTVGGGGLGNLAINYGYQRFDISVMLATILVLIALVQLLQWLGDQLVNTVNHV